MSPLPLGQSCQRKITCRKCSLKNIPRGRCTKLPDGQMAPLSARHRPSFCYPGIRNSTRLFRSAEIKCPDLMRIVQSAARLGSVSARGRVTPLLQHAPGFSSLRQAPEAPLESRGLFSALLLGARPNTSYTL